MDIAKQIVDQRIRKIIEENPDLDLFTSDDEQNLSTAFLLLGVATYWDKDIADIMGGVTEGAGDGGIDAAYIEPGENTIEVTFFQAKYVRDLDKDANFPANAIEKAVSTVKSVFDPNALMLLNEQTRSVVDQIRSYIADGYIPYVTFVMLNNGDSWNRDGQNKIDNEFQGQAQVRFVHFNHADILHVISRDTLVNTKIRFSGKAVGEQLMYKPAVIGRVCVTEINELMTAYKDVLLDRNVRKFLGNYNTVNRDIRRTLLEDGGNFFFYNNGITMVCKKLLYNELQKDDWVVQTEGLQIINGGQTCHSIHEALKDNPEMDFTNTFVLVRLYAVGEDEQVAAGITKATNTQSPIDLRDLLANEQEQLTLELSAMEMGYTYKRKRDAVLNTNADTITSSVAAEAVYTVWRRNPHLLGRKRSELFNQPCYDEIFHNLNAAQMILAVLIYRYCDNMRRKNSGDMEIEAQRAYSQYTIAAMLGKRLLVESEQTLETLDHNVFHATRELFEQRREDWYQEAEQRVVALLQREFASQLGGSLLNTIDGRSRAAVFRRFEFVEKALHS